MPLHEERRAELCLAGKARWRNAKRLRARTPAVRAALRSKSDGQVPAPLPEKLLCGTRSRATGTVALPLSKEESHLD